jgi:hypothetical protein
MMSLQAMAESKSVAHAIRTPRAAALAGIASSVLFTAALVLVRTAVPSDPAEAGSWLSDSSRRDAVLLALSLVPFAGIAFLWFVGVLRARVGEAEDRFFAPSSKTPAPLRGVPPSRPPGKPRRLLAAVTTT